MAYKNNDSRNEPKVVKASTTAAGLGIGAIIVIGIIAVVAFFMFNGKNDSPTSVTRDIGNAAERVYVETKDAAKEVPQATKDAATQGDQPTTRPNADGSTDKLDQN